MKTIQKTLVLSFLVFTTIFLITCSNEDDMNPPVDTTAAFKGSFINSAHSTSGNVTVNKDKTILNFTNFKTDAGPNLDIYLVSNLSDVNGGFINLGDIKGINGNYIYDLPANTDFTLYKYVVVWCTDFNINFGYATLIP